jgi:hypothetical protein
MLSFRKNNGRAKNGKERTVRFIYILIDRRRKNAFRN